MTLDHSNEQDELFELLQLKAKLLQEKKRELKKLERLARHLQDDLDLATATIAREKEAELLKYNLHRVEKGASEISVLDYSDPDMNSLRVVLDPMRSPQDNLKRLFNAIRRAKRGVEFVRPRLQKIEKQRDQLIQQINDIENLAESDLLELRKISVDLPKTTQKSRTKKGAGTSPIYRTILSEHQRRILVGKGAKQNDELTFRVSKGNDWWFHVRDFPGSHVVVVSEGKELSSDLLIDAATLAAHFSKAKGQGIIDVCYTQIKNLKRAHGGPGQVLVAKEKVVAIKIDEQRLRHLLEAKGQT